MSYQSALAQPGVSLSTIQGQIANSPEAAADINNLYQSTLGRPADVGGLAAFQAVLAQPGASLSTVQADLASSPEAAADVNSLYQNVLGRPADVGGEAAFQQVLGQPGQSLATVRTDLINSSEAQQDIGAIYDQFDAGAPAGIHAADRIEGTVQLTAGLSLADLSYQIRFIDGGTDTVKNIPTNSTLTALSMSELFQTQLAAVGQSIINNFNPGLGIISVPETFSYSSIISGGQQTPGGFQINLGSGNSILLADVNESALAPHNFRFVG